MLIDIKSQSRLKDIGILECVKDDALIISPQGPDRRITPPHSAALALENGRFFRFVASSHIILHLVYNRL